MLTRPNGTVILSSEIARIRARGSGGRPDMLVCGLGRHCAQSLTGRDYYQHDGREVCAFCGAARSDHVAVNRHMT
jgi:hypothetical protein